MYISSPKHLAITVADQRKKLGLSQAEVADKVGLLQKTISAFENKPESSKIATLFQILASVNLDVYVVPKGTVDPKVTSVWEGEW